MKWLNKLLDKEYPLTDEFNKGWTIKDHLPCWGISLIIIIILTLIGFVLG